MKYIVSFYEREETFFDSQASNYFYEALCIGVTYFKANFIMCGLQTIDFIFLNKFEIFV